VQDAHHPHRATVEPDAKILRQSGSESGDA
jgi:hypothetical protein